MENGILGNAVPDLSLQCRENLSRWWSQRTLIKIYERSCTWSWTDLAVLWKTLGLGGFDSIRYDFQEGKLVLWQYEQWYITIWDKEVAGLLYEVLLCQITGWVYCRQTGTCLGDVECLTELRMPQGCMMDDYKYLEDLFFADWKGRLRTSDWKL